MVTKVLKKNLEAIPGKQSIDSLQKTAVLGTSHIIRKVLQCETFGLGGGDQRWLKRSTKKKKPAARDNIITITDKYRICSIDKNKNNFLRNDTIIVSAKVITVFSNWPIVSYFRGSCCLSNQGR
jgi:hypothetical protein